MRAKMCFINLEIFGNIFKGDCTDPVYTNGQRINSLRFYRECIIFWHNDFFCYIKD